MRMAVVAPATAAPHTSPRWPVRHDVGGVDIDEARITSLEAGPWRALLRVAVPACGDRAAALHDLAGGAVAGSRAQLLCVGTRQKHGECAADLKNFGSS